MLRFECRASVRSRKITVRKYQINASRFTNAMVEALAALPSSKRIEVAIDMVVIIVSDTLPNFDNFACLAGVDFHQTVMTMIDISDRKVFFEGLEVSSIICSMFHVPTWGNSVVSSLIATNQGSSI